MAFYDILNGFAWAVLISSVAASLGAMTWMIFNMSRYGLTCDKGELHPFDVIPARIVGFIGTFLISPVLLFATFKLPLFIFTYAFCPSSIEAPG